MAEYQFNAQSFEPKYGGIGGLPAGKYRVVIENTELKPTKENKGGFLEITMVVIEGPQQGGKMADRLNLHNANQQTVQIANQQLSAYCHAIGVFMFNNTVELHNKPFMIEVRPQKANPEYTEVAAVFDVNGNKPGAAGGGAPAQPAPAAAAPPAAWGAPAATAAQPGAWGQGAAQPAPAAPAAAGWAQGGAPAAGGGAAPWSRP